MAGEKKTIDKVKELLETNAYAPLKETAEKWIAAADEKYGDKFDEFAEKAAPAMDKLEELAVKASDLSIEANEKLAEAGEKFTEMASPVVDKMVEAANPVMDKAMPIVDKVADNELVKKLLDGISTFEENIAFFASEAGKAAVGEEAAEQIRKHAEEMRAQGKTYCDCPACTKAREILKDMGVELEESKEAKEPEETKEPEA